MADDDLETVADDYRKDPLRDVAEVQKDAGNKKPSLMKRAEAKVGELKEKYSRFQAEGKAKAKLKGQEQLEKLKGEREAAQLKRDVAQAKYDNKRIGEQEKALRAKGRGGGILGLFGGGSHARGASQGGRYSEAGGIGALMREGGKSKPHPLLAGGMSGGMGGVARLMAAKTGPNRLLAASGKGMGISRLLGASSGPNRLAIGSGGKSGGITRLLGGKSKGPLSIGKGLKL